MNYFKYLSILMLTLLLSACGGGGNNSLTGGGAGSGEIKVTSIQVIRSSATLASDQSGTAFVTISGVVRDDANNVVEGLDLLFSAESGSIEEINNGVTNQAGISEARLRSFGDVSNRTVTVTVTDPISGVIGTSTVDVTGTSLTVSGPVAVPLGDPATLTFSLTDGLGVGVSAETITLTSANGNTFDNPTPSTDASGEVQVVLATTAAGNDTITASVLDATLVQTIALSVTNDVFTFTLPVPNEEVNLGVNQTLTVQWQQNGVDVPNGSTIQFTADRGTLAPSGTAVTTGGLASVDISSTFAGASTITGTGTGIGGTPIADGPTTQLTIEFVADTPDSIQIQSFPDTVIAAQQSTITAVVRDDTGNRVKNVDVDFNIVQDPSGGQLSVSSDRTDSSGIATTTYTAGLNTTAQNAVEIIARVRNSAPTIDASTLLTVAGRSIDFVIGTGNDIFEISSTRFGNQYTVIATDIGGVPAAGEEIRLTVRSTAYRRGQLVVPTTGDQWVKPISDGSTDFLYPVGEVEEDVCVDEDLPPGGNSNGILDPGEDDNGNLKLDAGTVATIVAAECDAVASADPGSTQQALLTDAAGAVEVCVVYPQNFNLWTNVRLEATIEVDGGTENTDFTEFVLPPSAADINNVDVSPPGRVSPFGLVQGPGSCPSP